MASVAAVVMGVISLPALLFPRMLFIPAMGALIGFSAFRKTRQRPQELAGLGMARAGLILSLAVLILGSAYHLYIYNTEVPEGYQRVTFLKLQPRAERPDLPVSPEAMDYDGQKVFFTGYVLSDDKDKGLKKFVLVPDLGACCFGGDPELTKMIDVTLRDPMRTEFSIFPCKIGGTLKVKPKLKASALEGAYFYLDADYLQ